MKRILVTRTDRIGDLVLSTPVFAQLREAYPDAYIAAMVALENREIVEGNPYLNEVLLYDKRGWHKGLFGNLKLAREIHKKKFDGVVHLHATNRMHWLTWLARVPQRIGWNRRLPWALTHVFEDIKREGKKHEAFYNFEVLKPLGIEAPEELETYFPIQNRSATSLETFLKHKKLSNQRPWIALSPGASCPSKRWPASHFTKLIEMLSEEYDAEFILVGGKQDHDAANLIKRETKRQIYDFTGQLTLGMLGAFFEKTKLVISNDSGPAHISSAVGAPVLSIFGRKSAGLSPTRWRPLGEKTDFVIKDVGCQVCLAHECEIQFLCLDALLPEEVFSKAKELLSQKEASPL